MDEDKRKYWVIPEKLMWGEQPFYSFLTLIGYSIQNGGLVYDEDCEVGNIAPQEKGEKIHVKYPNPKEKNSLGNLEKTLKFRRILDANNLPYREFPPREEILPQFKKYFEDLISRTNGRDY